MGEQSESVCVCVCVVGGMSMMCNTTPQHLKIINCISS